MRLSFLKSRDILYKQFKDLFVPGLSIIDVMMFNSVEEIGMMLQAYDEC
ncbi:MAG: WbqC family protein [Spirochaetaceae bacterium]|nr:WbqC family protein [Spirochaetaceae bacterium]